MIKIGRATVDDAGTIMAFQLAMAKETEGLELDPALVEKGVAAVLADPGKGTYYVASEDGETVASLLITYEWSDWRNAMVWWFQSVYVKPGYRRQGVFRRLYGYVKEKAAEEGVAGLRLYVDSGNKRAQETYAALGMDGSHYLTFEIMF